MLRVAHRRERGTTALSFGGCKQRCRKGDIRNRRPGMCSKQLARKCRAQLSNQALDQGRQRIRNSIALRIKSSSGDDFLPPSEKGPKTFSNALLRIFKVKKEERPWVQPAASPTLQAGVINPNSPWYRFWWLLTIAASAFTGFLVPWQIAFGNLKDLYSLHSTEGVVDAVLVALFTADIILNFRVAYSEDDILVDDQKSIAKKYRSRRFWVDTIGAIPFDYIGLLAATGLPGDTAAELPYIACLKLLHLVRLYKVRWLFSFLEYDLTVSLLWVTMARNLVIVLYVTHWIACFFEFNVRQAGYASDNLIGTNADLYRSSSFAEQYMYALYWSVTTLAGNEWNGMDNVQTMHEVVANTCRASVFLLFNIALGAYILGTITLLVVKSDERTGRYRDLSANLRQYSMMNKLPEDLKDTMQEHLRLNFHNQEASDEQVLANYPTTIRRRILRYLYMDRLRQAYLFQSVPRKFLDAILSASRLELFLPDVEILASGDNVNEIFLVVQGTVELRSPLDNSSTFDFDDMAACDGFSGKMANEEVEEAEDCQFSLSNSPATSASAFHKSRIVGEGEIFGATAFFTEIPQLEAVSFPIASRVVLSNLKRRAEQLVEAEFPQIAKTEEFMQLLQRSPSSLMYSWASPELAELMSRNPAARTGDGFTARQELVLANLVRVGAVIQQHIAKQDEDRTTEFLYAASKGDTAKLRTMLQQGFAVDSADYDGRTALMLACNKGHTGTVAALLAAGADPHIEDNLGHNCVLEACYHGHDVILDMLMRYGTKVPAANRIKVASVLCSCVYECNMPLLRRLLRAGAPPDAGDYDMRTALHISAAEGNAAAVRMLVEDGGAQIGVLDRWGHTPLHEAQRVGAHPVSMYLLGKMAQIDKSPRIEGVKKPLLASQEASSDDSTGNVVAGENVAPVTSKAEGIKTVEHKTDSESPPKSWRETAGVRLGVDGDEWSKTVAAGLAAYQARLSRDDAALPVNWRSDVSTRGKEAKSGRKNPDT